MKESLFLKEADFSLKKNKLVRKKLAKKKMKL